MADQLAASGPLPWPVLIHVLASVLRGLGQAHDLIVDENWERVSLADLVWRQMKPFLESEQRLSIEGPLST